MDKILPVAGVDDDKMNKHHTNLLNNNKKDIGGEGEKLKDIPHEAPAHGKSPEGPMNGPLMSFTQMLEAMDAIQTGLEENMDDLGNTPMEDSTPTPNDDDPGFGEPNSEPATDSGMGIGAGGDDDLMEELIRLFTPILVMQGIEGDVSDRIQEACSNDNVLLERNIIKFDNAARMAQLRKVCALLITRKQNSEDYQMYKKAAEIQKSMAIKIQKDNYAAADALAQKFLVNVSTTNNSSVARQAAQDLLPETQH